MKGPELTPVEMEDTGGASGSGLKRQRSEGAEQEMLAEEQSTHGSDAYTVLIINIEKYVVDSSSFRKQIEVERG